MRISRYIEKLKSRCGSNLWKTGTLCGVGLYVYGLFINSVQNGIRATFGTDGNAPVALIEWNPFRNLAALFTPTGMGVTFFIGAMLVLLNKRGKLYQLFSGYHFERDKRGFDILPDGTHGTSGFMGRREMSRILERGKADALDGTILGKLEEDGAVEYLSPKKDNGLNEHVMVFGASGAGKSRGFVKPFILQCIKRKESLVLVDPKGEFFESMSELLKNKGYVVKSFNLLDMVNSDGWNVMADIETDRSLVQSMAEIIIRNTSNANERQDFWEKAELNLFTALIHYIQGLKVPGTDELRPIEERSLGAIYKMLAADSFATIEQAMADLPNSHPAKAPYGIFRLANRQIWGNIAIGLGNRLSVFQNSLVDKITKYNEIDLELPGRQPCAYFCIISDSDSSLEFLSSLFFSTLFVRLTNYARRHGENGRLPIKVNVCLDEFCNIGKILDFKKLISTVRSRGINCQVIAQSVAQLSDRYEKKEWEELIANCDLQLFLGGNDEMTAEYISHKCGMVTIGLANNQTPMPPLFSPILNSTKPYSQTRSNAQRALMLSDEVLRLSNDKCIVLLRGQKPLLLKKIIPDELSMFRELSPVRITDYVPQWRRKEEEREKQKKERKTTDTAGSVQEKSEQQKAVGQSRATQNQAMQNQAATSAAESPQKREKAEQSDTSEGAYRMQEKKQGGSTHYSFVSESQEKEQKSNGVAANGGAQRPAAADDDTPLLLVEVSPEEIMRAGM